MRFSFGQLIQQLLQHICPFLSDERVAGIMEASCPKAQNRPTVLATEELTAVLGDDAILYQEEQHPDQEKEMKSLRSDINRVVHRLRQKQDNAQGVVAGLTYWKGRADQTWTSEALLRDKSHLLRDFFSFVPRYHRLTFENTHVCL